MSTGALSQETNMEKVSAVMDKYGIPSWIYLPIAQSESNFQNTAERSTSREHSIGIFQINVAASPQYAGYDLTDPTVNSEVAAQNFILPAYNYAKSVTSDPLTQAEIVYSGLKNPSNVKSSYSSSDYINGGIKPQWTSTLKDKFDSYFVSYSGGHTGKQIPDATYSDGTPYDGSIGTSTSSGGTTGGTTATQTDSWLGKLGQKAGTSLLSVILIFLVIIAMAYAFFKLVSQTDTGKQIIELGGAADSIPAAKATGTAAAAKTAAQSAAARAAALV